MNWPNRALPGRKFTASVAVQRSLGRIAANYKRKGRAVWEETARPKDAGISGGKRLMSVIAYFAAAVAFLAAAVISVCAFFAAAVMSSDMSLPAAIINSRVSV